MLRLLPRNPENRQWAIAQLAGIGVGAILMVGMLVYVFSTRGFF